MFSVEVVVQSVVPSGRMRSTHAVKEPLVSTIRECQFCPTVPARVKQSISAVAEMVAVMPTVLMLLLGLAVSTLAAYVALDLARRVRVLRTRAGALWLLGAASAMAIGIWSTQLIGIAAERAGTGCRRSGACLQTGPAGVPGGGP